MDINSNNLKDMMKNPEYFMVSLSNRENLDLCIKHNMAGFTNSINGLWTFLDIQPGDYISFIYGARVKNLYIVEEKKAFRNAENLPPWKPITFKSSGKTYYFPFRLFLKRVRIFDEPMIRPEFGYVAENLLLRGGYRKTHFQNDTITLHYVSNMGKINENTAQPLNLEEDTFNPKIVFNKEIQKPPYTYYFHELILQSLIRRKLQNGELKTILELLGIERDQNEFEVLGEKALPEGFVDIFIKLKHPQAKNEYILIEVKRGKAQKSDIEQLKHYTDEMGNECVGGVLIASGFSSKLIQKMSKTTPSIIPVEYSFGRLDNTRGYTYEQLLDMLSLTIPFNN